MQIFADKKFKNPLKIIEAFDNESFIEAFFEIEKYRKEFYLLGYIRYEAKDIFLNKKIKSDYPLLYFEVFDVYEEFSEANFGENFFLNPKAQISYTEYENALLKVKEHISEGNTYQVNYTYDYKIDGNFDTQKLYDYILTRQKTPYNAHLKNEYEEILSFSPELFFEIENGIIKTKPMKGTVKRGFTPEEDRENIEFLRNDIKNRAENVMIVDLLRNDLGKIAKTGTVKVDKLFEIETHKTLHQMTSEISAELLEKATLFDVFKALFPCGSVTGAPKIRTMQIIDELEIANREVYCGAIGMIAPEKTVFSVPIRILQKKNNEDFFLCRVGGAIVWDSDTLDEWRETLIKIKFLSFGEDLELVETIKVENAELVYGAEHFERLQKSAEALGFEFNDDLLKIKPEKDGILRILLSKNGDFKTRYLPLEEAKTNRVTVSENKIDSKHPLLKHKTTYRPWYESSVERIKDGVIYDEIFFNEKNELTEGARSNVIVQIGGKFFTPPLESGLLNGILRSKMIAQGVLFEKKITKEELLSAENVYCINSVRGMKKVDIV